MALSGLRRLDHVGFTVPDLDEATPVPGRRAGLRVPLLAGAVRGRGRLDGRAPQRAPARDRVRRTASSGCGGQTVFEVFHYAAPDQRDAIPRNSDIGGHHIALYVDDLDAAVAELRAAGVDGVRRADREQGAGRGPPLGLLPRPVGDAVRAGVLSGRQGLGHRAQAAEKAGTRDVTARGDRRPPAASRRVADHLRDRDPARRDRARASGSGRRRSPSGSAPAGCRCARRCGCSRPRGWSSTRRTRAPGCRGWPMHEVDVIYRMRERLEPLALAESLPLLTDADHARLGGCRTRSRPTPTSTGSSSSTASSTSAPTAGATSTR